ncbi:MAG: hypothetical protein OQK00_05660, partial [Rhodobacteraceae bacterium]|nr:hypothetical protein [Paracoccaceae bacterium]
MGLDFTVIPSYADALLLGVLWTIAITVSSAVLSFFGGIMFAVIALYAPLVIRMPTGGGIFGGQTHSQSPEALFTHVSGLKTVVPSNPYDAKGLLVSAIRDEDPVLFMEPKRIYRAFREAVPAESYAVPIGKAAIAREGTDVTLISWGAMVRVCLDASEVLAR